jgi:putative DNA primase/helicase
MLKIESRISPEVIAARGYTTVDAPEELRKMGFAEYQSRVPALTIPIHDVLGELRFHRIRPDDPRSDRGKPNKVIKYEQPPNTPLVIDVPPVALDGLRDTSRRLWIVEGEKKADSLVSQGECAVALLGVWAWKRDGYPLPDWDQIPMIGREVRVLFDSDTTDKVEVRHALYALSRFIWGKVHGS